MEQETRSRFYKLAIILVVGSLSAVAYVGQRPAIDSYRTVRAASQVANMSARQNTTLYSEVHVAQPKVYGDVAQSANESVGHRVFHHAEQDHSSAANRSIAAGRSFAFVGGSFMGALGWLPEPWISKATCPWKQWSHDPGWKPKMKGGVESATEWIPPAFYQLPTSYCSELAEAGRAPREWQDLCSVLQSVWQRGGRFAHYGLNSLRKPFLPPRNEFDKLGLIRTNAGDAVLTLAARLVTQYFLGPPRSPNISRLYDSVPRWALFDVDRTSEDRDISYINAPGSKIVGVVVGGGGLIYFASGNSHQNISGWQWKVHVQHLQALEPQIFSMGIGLNTFQEQSDESVGYKREYRAAFVKSWRALAEKSSIIGLRETHSLNGMAAQFPLPARLARRVTYQPCATTLVGAVQPCLASTALLEGSRVLSLSFARDRLANRLGGQQAIEEVLRQLAMWAARAAHAGWTVEVIGHPWDADMLVSALRRSNVTFKRIEFDSRQAVYKYYKTVAVAAAMRGYGVMVPFGIHCATISLHSHEKVRSFLQDIKHPEWGVELTKSKRPGRSLRGLADELSRLLSYIDVNRGRVYQEIREAQARLMEITASNILPFGQDVMRRARDIGLAA